MLNISDRADIVSHRGGKLRLKWLGGLLAALLISFSAMGQASAETRSLKVYFIHTKERAEITYKRNGRYLQSGLDQLNRFLRDWRENESTQMDPLLFDIMWEIYRQTGARDYIHIVSAYRSPETNKMLRSSSSGVAKNSQHKLGKAIDFYIPGVKLSRLRAAALKMHGGGVGYYPKSGAPFIHVDVGSVRHWPRMNRSELLALFPDGKTIHVPSDGRPLQGYEQAMAAYKARQRSGGEIQIASASSGGAGGGLLAALFGGGTNDKEGSAEAVAPPTRVAARQAPVEPAQPASQTPQTPATIIAALPPRAVPVPLQAPRPDVDVGPGPTVQAAAMDLPAAQLPAPSEQPVAVAAAVPLPTFRPDYTPVVETPEIAMAAISGGLPQSMGAEAISEMLNMSAAEARSDVIVNRAPIPVDNPLAGSAVGKGKQLAALASSDDGGQGNVFVLASLPDIDQLDADVPEAVGAPTVEERLAASRRQLAAISSTAKASPRIAVLNRANGTDAASALDSGVRTTAKSARPRASDVKPDPRPRVVPIPDQVEAWALAPNLGTMNVEGATAPSRAYDIVHSAPSTVYTAGFQQQDLSIDANRFTGKAVTFLSVARFD